MMANKLTVGPRMPGIYQAPQLSSKPGVFVSCDAEKRECRIPPVVRRQRRSPIARTYDADNPATAIDTILLKAVDDPSIINERRVDIMVVAMIVGTGIEVCGLTCKAHTVRSNLVYRYLTWRFAGVMILPSQESYSPASLGRAQMTRSSASMTPISQHWQTAASR